MNIANFVDDNAPFTRNTEDLIDCLQKAFNTLFWWFKDNPFKDKSNMYHLIVSTNKKTKQNIGENNTESSVCKTIIKDQGGQ